MTIKTITITDPKDYRKGDLFTGTLIDEARPGMAVTATNVLLVGYPRDGGRVFLKDCGSYPYADHQNPGDLRYWTDVTVTREVDEPSIGERLDALPLGSVIRYVGEDTVWFKHRDGWTSKNSVPSHWESPMTTKEFTVEYQPEEEA